jgi:hypothetical protein
MSEKTGLKRLTAHIEPAPESQHVNGSTKAIHCHQRGFSLACSLRLRLDRLQGRGSTCVIWESWHYAPC